MTRTLPAGILDFAKLHMRGMAYIDKTALVWRIARSGIPYFLSRPEHFGKSLLVSTLQVFWEGRAWLFEGLEIYDLESARPDAWTPHPVFHLDFSGADYTTVGALETKLSAQLSRWEEEWSVGYAKDSLSGRFRGLLTKAHESRRVRVVVLVDDYDKPLLDAMGDNALVEHNRCVLRGVYSVLSAADEHLESVFVTGVTSRQASGILPALGHMPDVSLSEECATVCGFTDSEIRHYLAPEVEWLAANLHKTTDEVLAELCERYGGYCFHPDGPKGKGAECVCNPHGVMCALSAGRINHATWPGISVPTFLAKRIHDSGMDTGKLEEGKTYVSELHLSGLFAGSSDPVPPLFQLGYLTIGDYDERKECYTLVVPNQTARESLVDGFSHDCGDVPDGALTSSSEGERTVSSPTPSGTPGHVKGKAPVSAGSLAPISSSVGEHIANFGRCLDAGDTDAMRDIVAGIFEHAPNTADEDDPNPSENYYRAVLSTTLLLLGIPVTAEEHDAGGFATMAIERRRHVYVLTIGLGVTAADVLVQIEERGYARRFAGDFRVLHRIGCSFDADTRLLTDWVAV